VCGFEGLFHSYCGEKLGARSLTTKVEERYEEVGPICFLGMVDNWSWVS
jgi:hypothetical protein